MMELFAQTMNEIAFELSTGQIGLLSALFLLSLGWFVYQYFIKKDPQIRKLVSIAEGPVVPVAALLVIFNVIAVNVPLFATFVQILDAVAAAYAVMVGLNFFETTWQAGK